MSKVLDFVYPEDTFLPVNQDTVHGQLSEDFPKVVFMGSGIGASDEDVIFQNAVHQSLEGLGCNLKAKRLLENLNSPNSVIMAVFGTSSGTIEI